MITLQYSDLMNQNLIQTLSHFAKTPFESVKDSYRLMRVMKKIESELKTATKLQNDLLDKYAKKDESGKMIAIKDADGKDTNQIELIDETIAEYQKKWDELKSIEFEVNAHKLSEQSILDAKLSPLQILTLEKFIEINDNELELVK